jgi:hypothetical protein
LAILAGVSCASTTPRWLQNSELVNKPAVDKIGFAQLPSTSKFLGTAQHQTPVPLAAMAASTTSASGDVRALLRNELAARRISHPYAAYTPSGVLMCLLCDRQQIKSGSLWPTHLRSAGHLARVAAARQAAGEENSSSRKRKATAEAQQLQKQQQQQQPGQQEEAENKGIGDGGEGDGVGERKRLKSDYGSIDIGMIYPIDSAC